MFDFHLHSSVSFDSQTPPVDICHAAVAAGLKEICFTDHYDDNDDPTKAPDLFNFADDIFGHVCTFQNRQPVFYKL